MTATHQPDCCTICGYYLTIIDTYEGDRCVDPGHWQAAGLLSPRDFYTMAQIMALARAERVHRADFQGTSSR